MREKLKQGCGDTFFAIAAGLVVAIGYYFFRNSNGFAPSGVGVSRPSRIICLGIG